MLSLTLLGLVAAAQAPEPIAKEKAEHYVWGGTNDGWHLVKQPGLSVIEERLAPQAAEVRHYHREARQFFYVLSGQLTMEVAGKTHRLEQGEGIEIPPGTPHQAQNRSMAPVMILVVSSPKSHGDRVEAPQP